MIVSTYSGGINAIVSIHYFNEKGIPSGFNYFVNYDASFSERNLFNANILALTRLKMSINTTITSLRNLYYIKMTYIDLDIYPSSEKILMNTGDVLNISNPSPVNSSFFFYFT